MNRIQPARGELPGSENITRTQFSNGLTVLVHTNPDSLSVVVTGYLLAGALYDQDEQLGLSHFTSLSLMRGTHSRSFHQIYSGLENRGASLGFGARIHTVSFSGRALAEDLPYLMQLLSDVIRNPAFPPAHIEKLRSQFLTSLAIRAQDTSEMASLGFNRMLYPNHPYGRPEDGYPETIQAITRQDLSLFHANHYGPRGTVIALVGPISADEGITLISKHFDDWTNEDQTGESALPDLKPINHSQRQHIPIPGKTQLDLVMGSAGPSRGSEDYYAAMVGNNILGQFGMMGRIGASVRVKSGLAYYAYSSLNAGVGPGSWEIIAGTNPSNIDQTIHLIRSEIQRFTNKPVLKGELADVKSNLVGRLPLAFESNGGVASALINMERYK
ncbi:MAG: insulinase family protein, partial [Anaerolineaceae bacterium]|nr:insulinase family protein [Anaerolineaceae bacterium]